MTPDAAVALVEAAFADVERPPDDALLHPQCFDDMDLRSLHGGVTWQDLAARGAEDPPDDAAPAFLSAAGFRAFLPGYLVWILRHPESAYAVVDSIVFYLTPPSGELHDFAVSKFALLDLAQRKAVLAFLEAMAPYNRDVGPALTYWRRVGTRVGLPNDR